MASPPPPGSLGGIVCSGFAGSSWPSSSGVTFTSLLLLGALAVLSCFQSLPGILFVLLSRAFIFTVPHASDNINEPYQPWSEVSRYLVIGNYCLQSLSQRAIHHFEISGWKRRDLWSAAKRYLRTVSYLYLSLSLTQSLKAERLSTGKIVDFIFYLAREGLRIRKRWFPFHCKPLMDEESLYAWVNVGRFLRFLKIKNSS